MLIDMHLHESKYSTDSFVSLEEIVSRAKEIGLDGVCITDHESQDIKSEAQELAEKTNFLIIVGAEVLTYEGDITVFGLPKLPTKMLHAQELLQIVHDHEGVAISAHPFRQNNRGMGNKVAEVKYLSGIEGFNGNTEYHHNLQAFEIAARLDLPAIGGSDAHHRHQVGKFATIFPEGIKNEQDLINAIKTKQVYPAFYDKGQYLQLDHRNTQVLKAI